MLSFEQVFLGTEVAYDEKKVFPLPLKDNNIRDGKKDLRKRGQTQFPFQIGGPGLLHEHGEKDAVMLSLWFTPGHFLSAGQINLLVRELCLCKQDALGIFFFLHVF